jgi:hypothetical protein
VVTLRFNKENPRNFLAPSSQQSQSQPTKVAAPKAKGTKPNSSGGFASYLTKESGEEKCWRCGWPHKKKDCPNPPQATTSNPNPNHPCSHCHAYAHDVDNCFTFHLELWQGQSQNTLNKGQGSRKGKKGKGAANKRSPTKPAQGQPNTMETKFA